jgi:tRNA pseudouridine38-40 synthase
MGIEARGDCLSTHPPAASPAPSVPVLKLIVEYDGAEFAGWAAQPGLRTVEGALGAALQQVAGSSPALSVAGRTDAGVHAWGQVVSFFGEGAELEGLVRSLNGVLPCDLAVIGAERAPEGFDARRDARSRTYCYRVLAREAPSPFERGRALWWPRRLDYDELGECSRLLPGTHDFTAFTPTRTDHVRFERDVLRSEWKRVGDVLEFWIEADAFMRHMVRILVGTMLEVAEGKRDLGSWGRLLEGAARSEAGETVAAHGLYLAEVRY